MRDRYDKLVAEAARFVDSDRDPERAPAAVAALFRAGREVERLEGIDVKPVLRVVLEKFELDHFGPADCADQPCEEHAWVHLHGA
jgi:hypothetical protein